MTNTDLKVDSDKFVAIHDYKFDPDNSKEKGRKLTEEGNKWKNNKLPDDPFSSKSKSKLRTERKKDTDRDSLPLYYQLCKFALRILKVGSSLVTYAGQLYLEIFRILKSSGLKYQWIVAMQHSGSNVTIFERSVRTCWKPLLWHVKGKELRIFDRLNNFIKSKKPDKILHAWEQSTVEAEYFRIATARLQSKVACTSKSNLNNSSENRDTEDYQPGGI